MKTYFGFLLTVLLMSTPINANAETDGYQVVSSKDKENIILYAKETSGFFRDFKIDFKGRLYARPLWINEINPTYAPKIIFKDINKDKNKELIIILTQGYGTGILEENIYVFNTRGNHLSEVIVDNPLAIIHRAVKTKLTLETAEVIVNNKKYVIDINPLEIKPEDLFDDIDFGNIIDYDVNGNQLLVRVAGQISPAGGDIGSIVIVFEYKDNMYQAKTIEFSPS